MADRVNDLERVLASGVIAVLRLDSSRDILEIAQALVRGGVDAVEITLTVPGAIEAIELASRSLGDDVLVGAGTVLRRSDAERAISAGARFLVAPTVHVEMIALAHDAGINAVPGALSPTEIDLAVQAGADLIKLFPGRVATPGYFKDVLGPFPGARLLPTGNVDLTTAPEYFRAGAVAVGVGKALVDPDAVRSGDWAQIEERARAFRTVADRAREEA
jgi:2-dehydro-3-deoxyphosphogluconate aldolase / (4S)-4-hydroxy-2-oxoglutarate aldolase